MSRRKISGAVLLILCGLLMAGCIKTKLDTPATTGGGTTYDPSKVITVTTQVPAPGGPSGAATRGTPITAVSQMTTLGLFCSYSAKNTYDTTVNKPVYMFNEQLELHSDGFWYYTGTPVNWWNAATPSAADHYTFFAYAPFATASNGIVVTSDSTKAGIPTMSYTVPTNVLDQPDLMLAVVRPDIHPTGHPVALQMKHALTAVGFTIVGNGEQVTGISISGVSTYGELKMDGGAIAWTNVNAPQTTDFSASIAFDSGESYMTATSTQSNLITGDGYLMMVPQTFDTTLRAPAPKPLMTISFADGTSRIVDMTAFPEWHAGERITYNIILTPAGSITVTPPSVWLPYAAQTPAAQTLTVTCLAPDGTPDPTINWMLTSAQPWLTLSLTPGGAGTASVLGTGSGPVYLVTTENTGLNLRSANIFFNNVATNVVSTIYQGINTDNIAGGGTAAATNTYGGAFWRASQTGERIIRISGITAAGAWSASVGWYDDRWNPNAGDGIVLSAAATSDAGITWNAATEAPADMNVPSNDATYSVSGGAPTVSGTVATGGTIMFRIGLQRQFAMYSDTPDYTSTFPARYAVVLLSYAGNTQVQEIFIRQGEGADYVMRNSDLVNTGNLTVRTQCRQFPPYNLTAADMNAQVDIPGTVPAVNPGIFTQYPTQAGAVFQWASPNYTRYAWDTHTAPPAAAGIVPAQWAVFQSGYWTDASNLYLTHETCPPGYRRPNDGPTDAAAANSPDITQSEIRQSLFMNPQLGALVSDLNNSIWCYYADGFFDRRQIRNAPTGGSTIPAGTNCSVSIGNDAIAHVGRLFFNRSLNQSTNPASNASLFLPAAGYRINTDGTLNGVGNYGFYLSSSTYSTASSWYLEFNSSIASQGDVGTSRLLAFPVRCVKD